MLGSLLATTPYHERGVIYFSSIPRNMRPVEVRLHFNRFGDITRMRFIPMPKKERRPGGPLLPLQFKEAWIEFAHANEARRAAREMNSTPVECKRQRRCYGQLWTVKYLDEFRWDMLAEERECERRMRRANEVQARSAERQANELYRKMMLHTQRRQPTSSAMSDADCVNAKKTTKLTHMQLRRGDDDEDEDGSDVSLVASKDERDDMLEQQTEAEEGKRRQRSASKERGSRRGQRGDGTCAMRKVMRDAGTLKGKKSKKSVMAASAPHKNKG